jgi:hypothetical protein
MSGIMCGGLSLKEQVFEIMMSALLDLNFRTGSAYQGSKLARNTRKLRVIC